MSEILENPHGNCALGGANATFTALRRVIAIYHSGPGCAMQTTAGEASQGSLRLPYYTSYTAIPCTNMLEREVVFGGEEKLEKHLEGALEILDADAFFVLTGCTAGIIGDDVQSVVQRFQAEGHPVYAVETAGFLGESYRGHEIAWNALFEHIVDKNPPARDAALVNIFGIVPYHDPYFEGNLEEITRLLEKLGLRVNTFFSHGQGIAEVKSSSSAALNIVLSPWLLKGLAEKYEKSFGIPSLRFAGAPLGATDTAAFLRAVGTALGKEEAAERVIAQEEEWYYRYLETGIGLQSWRRFSIVGESGNVIPITRFLANDYSFTPEIAICTDVLFRPADKAFVTEQLTNLEYAQPPELLFTGDQWEINQALARYPDAALLIGSTNEHEFAIAHGQQFFLACYPNTERLIYNRSCAGYRGALTLIEDIYSNL
ncbi:MAG: nitrogen fixation protein NifK [Oscillospiraceae bacterium]|jgi:nitrogenase molybdenum-iron protein beta chain|nr:nitrogen fixation protein NifK [Oscillospiraceae bacterium]